MAKYPKFQRDPESKVPEPEIQTPVKAECPDGPWKDFALAWVKQRGNASFSSTRNSFVWDLSVALAKAGNQPDKTEAIYNYLTS